MKFIQVNSRVDERTHFESASGHLGEIVMSTERPTGSIVEHLEEIDNTADGLCENNDAGKVPALYDKINENATAVNESLHLQDIIGQRVGKIVKSIQFVEERIDAMVVGRDDIEDLPGDFDCENYQPTRAKALLNGQQLPG